MASNQRDPVGMRPTSQRPGWLVPVIIAGVVLVAGAMIFGAAGPDRTRTADYNNPNSNRAPVEQSQSAESAIPAPSPDAPRSTPAPTVAPQQSNPAGTR